MDMLIYFYQNKNSQKYNNKYSQTSPLIIHLAKAGTYLKSIQGKSSMSSHNASYFNKEAEI
jgi:hypothetical protein